MLTKTIDRISFSKMTKYQKCPKEFYWHYVEGWRTDPNNFNLIFGTMVHEGLAKMSNGVPLDEAVAGLHAYNLTPYKNHVWMLSTSSRILKLMHPHVVSKDALLVEKELKSGRLVGIIDLYFKHPDGKLQLMDWKTSADKYRPHTYRLSSQLTMYQLLLEDNGYQVDGLSFGIMTKTPYPEYQLLPKTVEKRSPEAVRDFRKKVEWITERIDENYFPMNDGYQCAKCDFLQLCMGVSKPVGLIQEESIHDAVAI